MAEIIGLVATVVNTIPITVQACIKKIEDDVKAPFKANTHHGFATHPIDFHNSLLYLITEKFVAIKKINV
jgi:hypothetical protein